MIRALLAHEPINIAEEWVHHAATDTSDGSPAHGATASFVGCVRGDGGLNTLFLEHHPIMTVAILQRLASQAQARWSLSAVTLVHRAGVLVVGEIIVLIIASSPHREEALNGCSFLIDRIKVDVPFWKKETFADGRSRWVDQRESDRSRAAVWESLDGK